MQNTGTKLPHGPYWESLKIRAMEAADVRGCACFVALAFARSARERERDTLDLFRFPKVTDSIAQAPSCTCRVPCFQKLPC